MKKGFTLIELLLYVAISSTVLLTVSVFMSTLIQSRLKNQTVSEVEQQGVQVMQEIIQTVRNAESINSPTAGSNSSTLSLAVSESLDNPTVYDLSSSVIRITEGAQAAIPLTNSRITVSNLTFNNLSRTDTPGIIRISFTLTHINPEGRNEYDFAKTFYGSASLRHP